MPSQEFDIRVIARDIHIEESLTPEVIDKTIEIEQINTFLQTVVVDKVAELLVVLKGLTDVEVMKAIEILVSGQLQGIEISKTVESLFYNLPDFSDEQARQIIQILEPIDGIEEQSRSVVFLKDPTVVFEQESPITSRVVSYTQTENFQVVYADIYKQRIGSQINIKNQVDAFCTILWQGSFDNFTRFAVAFTKDPPGASQIIPIDLSLPKTTSLRPLLSWNEPIHFDSDQSIKYDIQIATNFSMRRPIYEKSNIEITEDTIDFDLSIGTYYWRVRSKDYYNDDLIDIGEWTNVYSFQIVESLFTQIPSQSEITWDHSFLLPFGKNYYFWDTRNLTSCDTDGNEIAYRPVVIRYVFNSTRTEVISSDSDIGLSFYVNHFAANPPVFLSAVYDHQSHNVIVRVQIHDSLGRLYQLSDFQYLNKGKDGTDWEDIDPARIIGQKTDLSSAIIPYTNRGLITWQASADPDEQYDQDIYYNVRFLNSQNHRNNNFYYLMEYLTEDMVCDIFKINAINFGQWWGTKYNEDDLPSLIEVNRFSDYNHRDIIFSSKPLWKRLQVEVDYIDTGISNIFDTQSNIGNFEISKQNCNFDKVCFSDSIDINVFERSLTTKSFDITDIIKNSIIESNISFNDMTNIHVVCEIRNNQSKWGESVWGQTSFMSEDAEANLFYNDYVDLIQDSNIGEISPSLSTSRMIIINSLKDFGLFKYTDVEDVGWNLFPFNGIDIKKNSTEVVIELPYWVNDNVEIKITLIKNNGSNEILKNPFVPMLLGDNFNNLNSNPGSMISLTLDKNDLYTPGAVIDFAWRVRGSVDNVNFDDWTDWKNNTCIDDSNISYNKNDYIYSKVFSPVFMYKNSVIKVEIIGDGSVVDTFYSHISDDRFLLQSNNKQIYWSLINRDIEDWDVGSDFRLFVYGDYDQYESLEYNIYELNTDTTPNTESLILNGAFDDYEYFISKDYTYRRSDIFKSFSDKEQDSPLFRWNATREESNGHIIIDLKHEYTSEGIEIDFLEYPNISLEVSYYDPITFKWKKLISSSKIISKVTVGGNIKLSKLDIKFSSYNNVSMKMPKIMAYQLVSDTVDTESLVHVDTEDTDIVMNNWTLITNTDAGTIVDPNSFYTPNYNEVFNLEKYTTYRNNIRKTRVSLFRDKDAMTLLMSKSGMVESDIVFTNIELYQNDVTNIVLDFKNIEETFYELTYDDISLLEDKIREEDYYISCRCYDGIEWSSWSDFAQRRQANIHTIKWSISGMNLDPTKRIHFRCKATISSSTVDMNIPIIGFSNIAGKEIIDLESEQEIISLVKTKLSEKATMYQEMVDNRIDPEQDSLTIEW